MATRPHVLLIGGHGRVSLLLTPLLLLRSWDVTSVIRDPAHEAEIRSNAKSAASQTGSGSLDVLVNSVEDVQSIAEASKLLNQVKANWVVWSAGAGGKGGPSRTYAVDRDAAKAFIQASVESPNVQKFLMVSALSNRRHRAGWWNDEDWALVQKMNTQILPHYYAAKLEADEYLTQLSDERRAKELAQGKTEDQLFQTIILRPGGLSDESATGKVALGKSPSKGFITRADVADVAARLLEYGSEPGSSLPSKYLNGWFDLLGGEEDIGAAVEKVGTERINAIDGEH